MLDFPHRSAGQVHDPIGSRATSNSPATMGQPSSSGKPQTVFIHKLFDMLEDPSLSHLIWWSPSQDSFCLYPGEEFSNVLAQYFKHTNIASFIRQLNMYGFHKVNDNFQAEEKQSNSSDCGLISSGLATKWEFRHSANHFRKGDVDSLSLIKRKSSKIINSHKEIVNLKSLPPTSDATLEEPKAPQDHLRQEQYHLSLYQHLWDQVSESGLRPSPPKDLPVSQGPGQHGYPVYSQNVPVPHSPDSPLYGDNLGTSYFYASLHPLSQQLRHASLQNAAIQADQSINFKLIEMNASIASLRASYLDLLSRYDSLFAMHHKSQTDLLQLTEIVEGLLSNPGLERNLTRKEEAHIDRKLAKTPVENLRTYGTDMNTSPGTVKPAPKTSDLTQFKSQLQNRVPVPVAPTSTSQKHQSQASYSLNDSGLPATRVSNAPIVPQAYPLNPNYTLYSYEGMRQLNTNGEEPTFPPGLQPPNRHVSIFVDPLQPTPGRGSIVSSKRAPSGSKVLADDNPLTPVPSNSSSEKEQEKPVTPVYVQQYKPIAPNHVYYQHMMHEPAHLRTASLPVIVKPLPQSMKASIPQRHSLTDINHPAVQSPLDAEQTRKVSPSRGTATGQVTSQPAAPHLEPSFVPKSEDGSSSLVRKQLPSMQELNQSIRSGSPVGRIFGYHEYENDDEKAKRRKLEE